MGCKVPNAAGAEQAWQPRPRLAAAWPGFFQLRTVHPHTCAHLLPQSPSADFSCPPAGSSSCDVPRPKHRLHCTRSAAQPNRVKSTSLDITNPKGTEYYIRRPSNFTLLLVPTLFLSYERRAKHRPRLSVPSRYSFAKLLFPYRYVCPFSEFLAQKAGCCWCVRHLRRENHGLRASGCVWLARTKISLWQTPLGVDSGHSASSGYAP
jgi:hypothetical protein